MMKPHVRVVAAVGGAALLITIVALMFRGRDTPDAGGVSPSPAGAGRSSPGPAPPATLPVLAGAAATTGEGGPDLPPFLTVEQTIAEHLATPATAPAADPARWVGNWQARVTQLEVGNGAGAVSLNVGELAPFAFSIRSEGGKYLFVPPDGQGKPRTLEPAPGGLLARSSAGREDLHLVPAGDGLDGWLAVQSPAPGRMQFHAIRK